MKTDLIQQIETDMTKALKVSDSVTLQTLRSVKAACKNAEIEKREKLSEEDVIKILRSEIKKRKDSVDAYQKGNRNDLAEKESKEIEIINTYLPELMTEHAIREIVEKKAQELGISDKKDFGKLMGAVMKEVGSRADGSMVKESVQRLLQ